MVAYDAKSEARFLGRRSDTILSHYLLYDVIDMSLAYKTESTISHQYILPSQDYLGDLA